MPSAPQIRDDSLERGIVWRRVLVAALFCLVVTGLLISRVGFLQVADHEHFSTLSENNRIRLMPVAPTRGLIFDRNGEVLAENRPGYQLVITPEEVEDLEGTLERLQGLVEISDTDLERFHRDLRHNKAFDAIPLRLNLSEEEVARFAANRPRFPGVDVVARLVRHYPHEGRAVHAVGYVGRINERELQKLDPADYRGTTHVGKVGIERYYEDRLHGDVGYRKVEVDAEGRILRELERVPPQRGQDVHLTLDLGLQAEAAEALEDYNGSVVALDPRNGEVLAFVSQPTYDPNLFVNGISQVDYSALATSRDRPLFNRALAGQYPPGSTIKPFMGLAGIEHRVIDPEEEFFAGPYYQLPNDDHRYRDWKKYGHGWVDLDKAIAQSCDVYFYDMAYKLGIDRMHGFLGQFGLGRKTGIDLPGEVSGLLPSREWKRRSRNLPWYPGETLIAGIGQGYMLSTPLQLATATAALANRGEVVTPHLLGETDAEAADDDRTAIELRRESQWDTVIQAMKHVVHSGYGTARRVGEDLGFQMAGKTGTAQVFGLGQDEEYNAEEIAERLRDHALFVAFAPVENPRIAVAVVVENGGSGSSVAAPIARRVLNYWMERDASDDPEKP